MAKVYREMTILENVLSSGDIDTLTKIISLAQERANVYKHYHTFNLSDDDYFEI